MYRQLTVVAGRTLEVRKYHSYKAPNKGLCKRDKNKKPTKEAVKKANERRAEDSLRWLMNTVFKDGDLSITLTYEDAPKSIAKLKEDAQDFVRRMRVEYRKRDTPLWYVYALGAGPHRRHIHITVRDAGMTPAEIKDTWGLGRVQITPLYSGGQYRELASYYIRNGADTRAQQIAQGEKPGRYYFAAHGMPRPVIDRKTVSAATFRKAIYERAQAKHGYRVEKGSERYFINNDGYEQYEYTLIRDKDYEDRNIHDNRQEQLSDTGQGTDCVQHGVRAP